MLAPTTGTYTTLATNTSLDEYNTYCALTPTGTLYCWGDNRDGKVDDTPQGDDFIQVVGASEHFCALHADQHIECWGWDGPIGNNRVQGAPTTRDFVHIEAGYASEFVCALDDDGAVSCWGSDTYGQVTDAPTSSGFTALTLGYRHACALDSNGAITCWGADLNDQVSEAPTGNGYTAFTSGEYHSCALDALGELICWGDNYYSQKFVPQAGPYTAVASGMLYNCALTASGDVHCWEMTTPIW